VLSAVCTTAHAEVGRFVGLGRPLCTKSVPDEVVLFIHIVLHCHKHKLDQTSAFCATADCCAYLEIQHSTHQALVDGVIEFGTRRSLL
jgi:hypothetical protein